MNVLVDEIEQINPCVDQLPTLSTDTPARVCNILSQLQPGLIEDINLTPTIQRK